MHQALHEFFAHQDDAVLLKHFDELLFTYAFARGPAEQVDRRGAIVQVLTPLRAELDRRGITWDRIDEVSEALHFA